MDKLYSQEIPKLSLVFQQRFFMKLKEIPNSSIYQVVRSKKQNKTKPTKNPDFKSYFSYSLHCIFRYFSIYLVI